VTEDVSAGRLYADVVADTTGFARDAKKKIDAEVRAIKARIKAEIDTRGLAAQAKVAAKTAAAEASKAAVIRLKVKVDARGLAGQVKVAAAAASKAAVIQLKTDIDGSTVIAKAKAAAMAASAAGTVSLPVKADTSSADGAVDAFKKKATRAGIDIPVRVNSSALGQASKALSGLSKAPAIAGGIYLLGTAIVQLGGGLIAVTSAASQAVGVLGAIPNLIGIAGQGIAALLIGFNGVGSAISAIGAAETATTAATADGGAQAKATARAIQGAMQARARAAQGVKDAQRSLGDAEKAANDQSVSGARAVADAQRSLADARAAAVERSRAAIETVSDAEWSLARAQESSIDAQKALTQARVDAKQRIDDLNAALKTGALNEEDAALAVEKARQNLQDTNWNVMSSDQDKKEAALAVKQAEDNLGRVKDANGDLAKDAAKANKDGVEGASAVQNARDAVRDALHAEQEDTENLANAHREAAQSAIDSARSIADAQRSVADAVKANSDGAVAASRAIEDAQRGVVDAKQGYVDAQQAVADANETAAAGGTKAAAAQTALAAAMAKLSPAGQRFAKFIYGLKPQWTSLRDAVQGALLPPIQEGVTAALPLLGTLQTGLVDSATVAGGLGKSLGEALGEKSFRNDVGTIMDSNNVAMQSFGDAGLNVVQILRHMAVAVGPLVERFAEWTEKLTGVWAEEIKTARETGKLEDWFNRAGDTAAQLGGILGNIGGALVGMGKAAAPAGQQLLDTFEKVTQKWQTFTESDAGQARMKAFFDATVPVTDELAALVANLVLFITNAGEAGGGSLLGFLKTLNLILDGLNKFLAIPGAGPAFGMLMTLAGVGGALGLVASMVLKIGTNLGKLGKFTGLSKLISGVTGAKDAIDDELPKDKAKKEALEGLDGSAKKTGGTLKSKLAGGIKAATSAIAGGAKALAGWVLSMGRAAGQAALFTAKLVAQRAVLVATKLASYAMRAATIAWTAVQWLLNAALTANPIGLLIIGVGLLIGAFIWAMIHSAKFRAAVVGALSFILSFIVGTWTRVTQLLSLPVYIAIALIKAYFKLVFAIFNFAKNWVFGAFKGAWDKVSGMLSGPLAAARDAIGKAWGAIKGAFTAAKDWVVGAFTTAWNKVRDKLTGPITAARDAVEKILGSGKGGLQAIFSASVSAISRIWNGLQDAAKKPIKFIVNTVLNDGLISGFNWIAGKVGAPNMDPIKLPGGFEAGGQFTGRIPGAASKTDNILAHGPRGQGIGLATGEYIVNSEDTRKHLPLLEAINSGRAKLNSLGQGFADGGLFGKVKGAITGAAAKGKDFGGDVIGFLRDPGGWFKTRMSGPLDRMKELGDSQFAETVKRVPRKIVDVVAGKAKALLSGLAGSGGDGGGGGPINPGLAGALNWVKTQVGKPYLWGGVGPNGYDCSGLMGAIVNVIRGAKDPFQRLFATGSMPAGIFEKGPGAFQVGWFTGNPGHTAGTLNGVNVESRGGKGVVMGANARGARDSLFNSGVYHLKGYAKGGLFGDPPYDLMSPHGKATGDSEALMKALGVTFDTGGWLNTGPTVVQNSTGDHEAILKPDAWRAASSVLSKIAAMAAAMRINPGSGTAGGGAPLVGALSIAVTDKRDLPGTLDEAEWHLQKIRRGGVYAADTAA
jgi:hypothetical protein